MALSRKNLTAVAAAAGILVAGGATVAYAANGSSGTAAGVTANGYGQAGQQGGPGGSHTAVTGDELAKVKAAVTAKDSAVTVTSVQKDADGSYDVFGTKSGSNVMLDVSKDLATITTRTGGPGGGGGSNDTPVTGTTKTNIEAAVKAKDSAITITEVRMDPDGSYDVLGTSGGSPVFYNVSKDLKTIEKNTMQGGPGGHGGQPGQNGSGSGSTSTNPTDANGAA